MAITPLAANHSTAKEYAQLNLPRRFAGNRQLRRSITESLARGDNGRLAYAADSADVLEWVLMVTKGLFAYHFHRPLHGNWEPRIRHVTAAQEAEGIAAMQALVGPGPEDVHRNLGEGTVEYWDSGTVGFRTVHFGDSSFSAAWSGQATPKRHMRLIAQFYVVLSGRRPRLHAWTLTNDKTGPRDRRFMELRRVRLAGA